MVFGTAMGTQPDLLIDQISKGSASIFYSLGIPILAGSVMAKYLAEGGYIQEIISDLRGLIGCPSIISAISGYIVGIPSTCPITAFMILSPVTTHFTAIKKQQTDLMYLVAIGSAVGVAYVYPTPVTFSLFETFASTLSPLLYDLVAIPLSLLFLVPMILLVRKRFSHEPDEEESDIYPRSLIRFHPKAWAPFIAIIVSTLIGLFILNISHFALVQFIMLSGMVTSVCIASPLDRWTGFVLGAKHAGVVVFDICGAGALGYVITSSTFTQDALQVIGQSTVIPMILTPFILSALIQTAQGSRIVTASTTSLLLAGTTLPEMMNPLALFLMIIAGAGVICFVTDPYFWLLHRETGDVVKRVFTYYTLPQIVFGLVSPVD